MKTFTEFLNEASKLKVGDKVKEDDEPMEMGIITKVEKKTFDDGTKYDFYTVNMGDHLAGHTMGTISLATQKDFDRYAAFVERNKVKIPKKKKSLFQKLKGMFEEVSTSSISSSGAMEPIKAHGKAFGQNFFEVDDCEFDKCRMSPKKKYKHWKKLLNSSDIQKFAKQSKEPFLIKRKGYDQYLRAR